MSNPTFVQSASGAVNEVDLSNRDLQQTEEILDLIRKGTLSILEPEQVKKVVDERRDVTYVRYVGPPVRDPLAEPPTHRVKPSESDPSSEPVAPSSERPDGSATRAELASFLNANGVDDAHGGMKLAELQALVEALEAEADG